MGHWGREARDFRKRGGWVRWLSFQWREGRESMEGVLEESWLM